jgi:hypothetical protein
MRKVLFVAALFLLSGVSAKAQQAELFGGYSYEHFSQAGASANLNGWDFSLNYKLARVAGIVGDFSGTYGSQPAPLPVVPVGGSGGSPSTSNTSIQTYLVGPQFSYPGKFSPFFHVMFGAGRLNIAGAGDTNIATAIGGGIDVAAAPHIAIRAFQFDDVITRFGGSTQNNPRISVGVVLRF